MIKRSGEGRISLEVGIRPTAGHYLQLSVNERQHNTIMIMNQLH